MQPVEPRLIPFKEYLRLSGDSRSTGYEKLRDGRIKGVKDGKTLKIIYESAAAHIDGLPRAIIRPRPAPDR